MKVDLQFNGNYVINILQETLFKAKKSQMLRDFGERMLSNVQNLS